MSVARSLDVLGQVLRGYVRRVENALAAGDRKEAEEWLAILERNAGPPERADLARLRSRMAT